jgi:MFS family permease
MKYENRLIWVLGITFGFLFFDRNAVNYLMPFIATELHFNNKQIGLVASALSFTWAIFSFLGGAYSDRTGHRKIILLTSVVAFSLCSFLSGLVSTFIGLFLVRMLMGLVEGPFLPVSQSLLAV